MCFFNPKLKQTKVRQVELNDRKTTTFLCFHYKKKGVVRDEKKTKKTKQKKQEEHCHKHSKNIFTVRDL